MTLGLPPVLVLLAAALSACTLPSADPDEAAGAGTRREAIVGGAELAECAWPSAVYLEHETASHCSGTLVHPELVVFAAHCMRDGRPPPASVGFGESSAALQLSVATSACKADPEAHSVPSAGHGHDLAWCKLAEPVLDVPIVPLLAGCETAALRAGTSAVAVGFGRTGPGSLGDGVKRAVELPVTALVGNEAYVGGAGKGSCHGDSGGPMFVRASRGQWRLFGVTSWAPGGCGDGEYVSLLEPGIAWLEQSTGIDLTPCHAADGSWAPTPECGRFPLEPERGESTWAQSCRSASSSGLGDACGPPSDGVTRFDASPDEQRGAGCSVGSRSAPSAAIDLLVAIALSIRTLSRRFQDRRARMRQKAAARLAPKAWHGARTLLLSSCDAEDDSRRSSCS